MALISFCIYNRVMVSEICMLILGTNMQEANKGSRIITLETKDGVNVALYTSSSEYITTGLSHNANIIYIDTKQLLSGEYTIRLQKGEDVKELMFSVKSL